MSVPFLMMVGSDTPNLSTRSRIRLDPDRERVFLELDHLGWIESVADEPFALVPGHLVQSVAVFGQHVVVQLGHVRRILELEADLVPPFPAHREVAGLLVQVVLDGGGDLIDPVGDRLVDVDRVDEAQTAREVEPLLDSLLEPELPHDRRPLLGVGDQGRDQV